MVFSEIGCTPENIVKKKGERNMRKKILKIMKWAGLILLGTAAALMVWNFICRQAERPKIQAAYGTVIEVQGHNMVVDIKGEDNGTTIITIIVGVFIFLFFILLRISLPATGFFSPPVSV